MYFTILEMTNEFFLVTKKKSTLAIHDIIFKLTTIELPRFRECIKVAIIKRTILELYKTISETTRTMIHIIFPFTIIYVYTIFIF